MFIFPAPLYNTFAKRLARQAKAKLGHVDVGTFSDGEIYARVPRKIYEGTGLIIGTTAPPADNLIQLLLLISAVRNAGIKKIVVLIPYFGYGRADRVTQKGNAVSAKIMAELLQATGVQRVITIQIHSVRALQFFRIPVTNITPYEIMAAAIERHRKQFDGQLAVVAPDRGAYGMAKHIARILDVPMAWLDKSRPKPNLAVVHTLHGNVRGKSVVLVDDMIDTAGTIIAAGQFLQRRHEVKGVGVIGVHGILSGSACERLRTDFVKKVILTDTIPGIEKKLKLLPRLKIISIIPSLIRVFKILELE